MKRETYPTEELIVTIEKVNPKGIGVVHYHHAPDRGNEGKKLWLFIPNVVVGDVVKVTVENAKGRRKASVDYDELIKPGPSRNLEIPTHKEISGGTPLQYMNYDTQLEFKENLVKDYLDEAGFDASIVQPIVGMEDCNRYRNNMELTFGPNDELGMHQQGNFRNIIDMEDSIIAPKVMVDIKHLIIDWKKSYQLEGYTKDTHTGLLRKLLMRQSVATNELMVVLFVNEAPDGYSEAIEDLVDSLTNQINHIASIMWVENTNISDQIIADKAHVLYGRDYIVDHLNGFRYQIYFDTFFQVNPVQAQKLVKKALEISGVDSDTRVVELFCGMGTFSLPLAKRAKELIGIELVESSIQSAKQNADAAGITNTRFFASDARAGLEKLKEEFDSIELLVLNPPRQGAGGKLMRSIGRFGSDRILYVSCQPKTLAEDLVWLKNFGYELQYVQPIDQFPHTVHVECVVLMQKVSE